MQLTHTKMWFGDNYFQRPTSEQKCLSTYPIFSRAAKQPSGSINFKHATYLPNSARF